ncbi:uncharacterized protein CTHT_0055620 [Thermochaetoides thermophila DSM 1495]|uniref:Allergen Asp f 4 n=1 Tax=Chaetomium thermophilum (strain DSM 1495 / CBS 144.50 / IMI 039719) TaxID=759272 RepID=G0SC22_CHATD|nr:hypothetical protein CTHT_0055620 [Thermochaetoides thermophila DSM 1495]EGS18948.1 hypothetical protein CTHT_0055620 [Thermochaetoides thermophila DSM 1495]
MQLTPLVLLTGLLGSVAAHPSGHAHMHRMVHVSERGLPFVKNVHNRPTAEPKTTAEPAPASTQAPEPKATIQSTKQTESEVKGFCGSSTGLLDSKAKRVTIAQVMYTGNLGTDNGCEWGSNLMVVSNDVAHKYKYVQKYTNVDDKPYQVVCGNKMGADRQLTGMFKVKGQNNLIFTLAPGETKAVVADENTQGVCAFAPYEVPLTSHGQYAGVWAEFDFGNTSNNGWSGADCSSLVAQAYNMDVPGCRMSHGGVNSDILPGGIGNNAYTKGMEELDGIGLNIVPGPCTIEVKVGFSG